MSKRVLIVVLAGVNLLLLAGLVFTVYSPPAAFAQAAAPAKAGSGLMLMSARAEVGNDAVFMIDGANRQLHAFRTTFPRVAGQPTQVRLIDTRDLARDFQAGGAR